MAINLYQAARDAAEKVANSPSAVVQQEVSRIKRLLQHEASRNTTGPAAVVVRRIESRAQKAMVTIKRLEGQLKAGTNQHQVRKQLGETIDQLFYHISMDWLELRLQIPNRSGEVGDRFLSQQPPWFRKLVELSRKRKGLAVAGGALRPFNLSNTTGNPRDPNFKGSVASHPALPEKQREGLRPDGLKWLYKF